MRRGVAVKLGRLLVKRRHRHGKHVGVGPIAVDCTLRHHDDERPALRMIANSLRQADLRLPHAFSTALAAPVQKQNDRPLLVVVAPPLFRDVDLVAIRGRAHLDPAIEKSCLLRWMFVRLLWPRRGMQQGGRRSPGKAEAGREQSQDAVHRLQTS